MIKDFFFKMNNFLYGRSSFLDSNGYLSLNLALCKLIGKKKLSKIIHSIPDQRQLLEEVGELKQLTESEVVKLIAEILELPVLTRLKPINLKFLPEEIRVEKLRANGVFPLMLNTDICGLACVDPVALKEFEKFYSGNNIYLTCWESILIAINESEEIYRANMLSEKIVFFDEEKKIFDKILARLSLELYDKKSDFLTFIYREDSILYKFSDVFGGGWEGKIEASIAKQFIKYLEYKLYAHSPEAYCNYSIKTVLVGNEGVITLRKVTHKGIKEGNKVIQFPDPYNGVEEIENCCSVARIK